MLSLITPVIALISVPFAAAWGDLGHETVGYIAQNFVKSSTKSWAQRTLDDSSSSYLANASTWADSYKYTDEGAFSAPFHYIDAEDNPPKTCNVHFDRDCGDAGCSVSAIANYTLRVQNVDGDLSGEEVGDALKFLIHFLGDITQPLHDEAFEVGGNEVNVTFDGEDTNLHSIWDTEMPEQLRGGYELSDAEAWANNLTAEIKTGAFRNHSAQWLEGLDIGDAKASAMIWARDANKFVCSVVMPNNVTELESGDLYPEYYHSAIGTVELQIAKAGYRLAKWLDGLADKQASASDNEKLILRDARDMDNTWRQAYLVPHPTKSLQRLRREAVGWGCSHNHKHQHS